MTLYKNKYRIETTRLKNWDYSSNGYYYITICTKNREHIFGRIVVETGLKPAFTPTKPVSTGTTTPTSAQTTNKKQHGLFEFVRAFKTFSSRRINELRHSLGTSVWQSRFYDRIVRDETELNRIREYIQNNPINWKNDDLNLEVAP
ncbi:MAG: transposase [Deltaproteobacteria bacterium]|nr:transposase [Deltaproteobacteria bacterium]MBW2166712.1 transposase [Deltaproteobacteria bacterium]